MGRIDTPGLVLLVGITHDDDPAILTKMAEKIWHLRIFADEKSAAELAAPMLVISHFTL